MTSDVWYASFPRQEKERVIMVHVLIIFLSVLLFGFYGCDNEGSSNNAPPPDPSLSCILGQSETANKHDHV